MQQPTKNDKATDDDLAAVYPGLDVATADAAWSWADEPAPEVPAPPCPALQSDGSYGVWPENWDTVLLFWQVRRCWRLRPMGGVMGYDWTTIASKMTMNAMTAPAMAREQTRLELMEDAVLEVIG